MSHFSLYNANSNPGVLYRADSMPNIGYFSRLPPFVHYVTVSISRIYFGECRSRPQPLGCPEEDVGGAYQDKLGFAVTRTPVKLFHDR